MAVYKVGEDLFLMEFGYSEDTSIVGTWQIIYILWFKDYTEGNY